jgi:hypothetical protein
MMGNQYVTLDGAGHSTTCNIIDGRRTLDEVGGRAAHLGLRVSVLRAPVAGGARRRAGRRGLRQRAVGGAR